LRLNAFSLPLFAVRKAEAIFYSHMIFEEISQTKQKTYSE
jgi:hypothetical protein